MRTDLVIIGGGPAGMAAALSAHEQGAGVLILERDSGVPCTWTTRAIPRSAMS